MDAQTIIVICIVAACAAFLVVRAFRQVTGRAKAGCGHCEGASCAVTSCPDRKDTESHVEGMPRPDLEG